MPPTFPPLSIVHLLAPARFGGLETVVSTLVAGQVATGDRVAVGLVLTPGEAADHPMLETLEATGAEAVAIEVAGRDYRGERKATRNLLARHEAHVLHTHGYRPDVVDAPVARRMGVSTVTTVHGFTGGGWRGRLYEWLQLRSFRSFDAVIPVSRKLEGELAGRGVSSERLHLVRNAWTPSRPALDRAAARRTLGIESGEPVVGWVGRLSREKAPDVMVRAMADLRTPGVRLSMIGTGGMESGCREQARSLGIADSIRWHGMVPDAASVLGAFDVLALTSWTEGTPMVLLEAMAAGVPIVATSVGGVPDVVSPKEAHLAEAGSAGGIAAAIDDIFADQEAAESRADAARSKLETHFAVGPWVERHRALYHSLTTSR